MKSVLTSAFAVIMTLLTLANCSTSQHGPTVKTFVLVHGAWQAPYVWKNVRETLEKKGHHVILVELPGHGSDSTAPETLSIDAYRDKVIQAISQVKGKVILVGHSMGGMVVSAVAEKVPNQIEKLVFIGAFVPVNGQSILELSMADKQSHLGAALVPTKDQLLLNVKPESLIDIFCQDATPAIQQLVRDHYRAEPAIPFTSKAVITSENFGKADKYYIHTLQDHAIGIDQQHAMATAAGITKTYSVSTGHSPFLTQPDEISRLLLGIAVQ